MAERTSDEHAVGAFPDRAAAGRGVDALLGAGFDRDRVGVVVSTAAHADAADTTGAVGARR